MAGENEYESLDPGCTILNSMTFAMFISHYNSLTQLKKKGGGGGGADDSIKPIGGRLVCSRLSAWNYHFLLFH